MPAPFNPASLPDVTSNIGPRKSPLWKGPSVNPAEDNNGGISFSMLSKYLVCRERFRVEYMLGLRMPDRFHHRMEYGNMWHVCEEVLAKTGQSVEARSTGGNDWTDQLKKYAQQLCKTYPFQQSEVNKWYNVCKVQFPQYVQFWEKHKDIQNRKPVMQEQVFSEAYTLPSGRTVYLRGKWDSVDIVTTEHHSYLWVQENKTKGEIDEEQLKRQLTFDLQSMLYLIALYEKKDSSFWNRSNKSWRHLPVAGIRYNVIRRPLSGGKGNIVRHKATLGSKCPKCKGTGSHPHAQFQAVVCDKCKGKCRVGGKPEETEQSYYNRLSQYIKDEPESYFMRWNVDVSMDDVNKFKIECLNPVLENLCDDYEWWQWCMGYDTSIYDYQERRNVMTTESGITHQSRHFRMPFGIYSPLLDGGSTDTDNYLGTGVTVGLVQNNKLFRELDPVT